MKKGKHEYITGRFLIRQATEIKKPILLAKEGKPYFSEGPQFSLSHSNKRSILAVSEETVGADIQLQDVKRPSEDIVNSYALPAEVSIYNSFETKQEKTDYFFQLWSLKESYSKAIGTGIDENFRTIEIAEYKKTTGISCIIF